MAISISVARNLRAAPVGARDCCVMMSMLADEHSGSFNRLAANDPFVSSRSNTIFGRQVSSDLHSGLELGDLSSPGIENRVISCAIGL